MAILHQAVEDRKKHLINQLMNFGYFKTPEGKQLYELTLTELETAHIEVKCKFGKEMNQYE
ncbi:Fur-regulated basic protein FbpA [Bacillus songklensis]|uniref:Fur-regulated basic protein FbpA n=1 Tax=Bacillus songklensis TaxID=1069116 RepID=A0ABV8B265_9BACI